MAAGAGGRVRQTGSIATATRCSPTLTGLGERSHLLSASRSISKPTSPTSSTCSSGRISATPAWCVHSGAAHRLGALGPHRRPRSPRSSGSTRSCRRTANAAFDTTSAFARNGGGGRGRAQASPDRPRAEGAACSASERSRHAPGSTSKLTPQPTGVYLPAHQADRRAREDRRRRPTSARRAIRSRASTRRMPTARPTRAWQTLDDHHIARSRRDGRRIPTG